MAARDLWSKLETKIFWSCLEIAPCPGLSSGHQSFISKHPLECRNFNVNTFGIMSRRLFCNIQYNNQRSMLLQPSLCRNPHVANYSWVGLAWPPPHLCSKWGLVAFRKYHCQNRGSLTSTIFGTPRTRPRTLTTNTHVNMINQTLIFVSGLIYELEIPSLIN